MTREKLIAGVRKPVGKGNRLWYKRTFQVPKTWDKKRVLLNFEAVDWETRVWVNGREAGRHRGCYDPFVFDILVDGASGWADRGVGDVADIHDYPGPKAPANEMRRAAVLSEFGGLGLPLSGHTWQEEANWGYRSFTFPEELTKAYLRLIEKLVPLVEGGLSAAVYTQTTDVEIEVNGLMTYDRAVIKMERERVSKANRSVRAFHFTGPK